MKKKQKNKASKNLQSGKSAAKNKAVKPYDTSHPADENIVAESLMAYRSSGQNELAKIIFARQGIKYDTFTKIAAESPFTISEWSIYLDLSERTMQRYSRAKSTFSPAPSEKILVIDELNKKGIETFGDKENYKIWLEMQNPSLGGIKPKTLLDTTIGVGMVKDELGRIEYGIFA